MLQRWHTCFFVDETLIFGKATDAFKNILIKFSTVTGHEINYDKSATVFSKKVSKEDPENITQILHIKEVDSHGKYLGLPSIVGKLKRDVFQSIGDHIWTLMNGWKEKLLSKARKEILIKSVAMGILTYSMSCFLLPNYLLKKIKATTTRFWWENNQEGLSIGRWKAF